MTMSAVARLMPRPPARVLSRKTNFVLSGMLNASIDAWVEHATVLITLIEPNHRFTFRDNIKER